jgi:hypothetical protein
MFPGRSLGTKPRMTLLDIHEDHDYRSDYEA